MDLLAPAHRIIAGKFQNAGSSPAVCHQVTVAGKNQLRIGFDRVQSDKIAEVSIAEGEKRSCRFSPRIVWTHQYLGAIEFVGNCLEMVENLGGVCEFKRAALLD